MFEKNRHSLNIAKVDCTDDLNLELCVQFKINGYPSLLLLHEDRYYKYKGPRDYDSLINFALGKDQPFKNAADQGPIPEKIEPLASSPNYKANDKKTFKVFE